MRALTRNASPELVAALEQQLSVSLRPVRPRSDFVDHLHTRLTTQPAMVVERRQNVAVGMLLVAFSLLSGVILIFSLRRLHNTLAN